MFLRGCSDHQEQLFCLFGLKKPPGLTNGVSVRRESGYVKGVPFLNKRYIKGVPFLPKWYIKKGKGLDLGAEPPRIKLC